MLYIFCNIHSSVVLRIAVIGYTANFKTLVIVLAVCVLVVCNKLVCYIFCVLCMYVSFNLFVPFCDVRSLYSLYLSNTHLYTCIYTAIQHQLKPPNSPLLLTFSLLLHTYTASLPYIRKLKKKNNPPVFIFFYFSRVYEFINLTCMVCITLKNQVIMGISRFLLPCISCVMACIKACMYQLIARIRVLLSSVSYSLDEFVCLCISLIPLYPLALLPFANS